MNRRRFLSILLCALLLAGILSGCSASTMDTAMEEVYNQSTVTSDKKSEAEMEYLTGAGLAPIEKPETEELKDESSAETLEEAEQKDTDYTEKIIYSADLSLETTDFDKTVSSVEAMISEFGGFIESANNWGDTVYESDGTTRVVDRHANYVIRVPANRFEEFLHQSGNVGNVISSYRYAENITSRYTDQEARKVSLQTQEERLLNMLSKSEDVESLIQLEARLAEVRYELEAAERTLRNWQMQVDYSTVTLDIREVEIYTPTEPVRRTFGQKLSSAFIGGWSDFVWELQYFVIGLVRNLPGLILFAVFAIAVVIVVVRFRKRRKVRKAMHNTPPADLSEDTPDNK